MLVGRDLRRLVGLTSGSAVMGVPVVAVTMQMNVGPRCVMVWL